MSSGGRNEGKFLGIKLLETAEERASLLKALVAEFLGTLVFVFFTTAVITSGCHTIPGASKPSSDFDTTLQSADPGSCFLLNVATVLNIALAFGFTLFVVVYATASFSGGHINPAVTLSMFIARRISLLRGILYIAVQCGGAAIASVILKGLDPHGYHAAGGASNQVSKVAGISAGATLGYEIIGTFSLVFTVFAATDAVRAVSTAPLAILAPLSIGMIVFVNHLMLIPVDGCSINPARSFGPAVVSKTFNHFWIFWVGPFAGAILAAGFYELGLAYHGPKHDEIVKDLSPDVEAGVPVAPSQTAPVYAGTSGLRENH